MGKVTRILKWLGNITAAGAAGVFMDDAITAGFAWIYQKDWVSVITLIRTELSIQFLIIGGCVAAITSTMYFRNVRANARNFAPDLAEILFSTIGLSQLLLVTYYVAAGRSLLLEAHFRSDPLGNFTAIICAVFFIALNLIRVINRPIDQAALSECATSKQP